MAGSVDCQPFDWLGQYANGPGSRRYYYPELFSPSTGHNRCAYQQRDGQAELAWMAELNTKMEYPLRVPISVLTQLDVG